VIIANTLIQMSWETDFEMVFIRGNHPCERNGGEPSHHPCSPRMVWQGHQEALGPKSTTREVLGLPGRTCHIFLPYSETNWEQSVGLVASEHTMKGSTAQKLGRVPLCSCSWRAVRDILISTNVKWRKC
jgi:hypothetical protein